MLRVSERAAGLSPLLVDRMAELASGGASDIFRLENLDCDVPPDPLIVAATSLAAGADGNNSYLPFLGKRDLREAAAAHVSRMSGGAYDADRNCIICAGGLCGILNVLLATIDPGDEVILTDPTYVGLINRVRLAGGVPVFVPLQFRPGDCWKLDRDALRSAVTTRTRMLLLMSPSMPSGAVLTDDDWTEISTLCVSNDFLLLMDAAMERLVFDVSSALHPASLPGMADRTIIVGSAAKELRLIGWRVGWIVAPDWAIPGIAWCLWRTP